MDARPPWRPAASGLPSGRDCGQHGNAATAAVPQSSDGTPVAPAGRSCTPGPGRSFAPGRSRPLGRRAGGARGSRRGAGRRGGARAVHHVRGEFGRRGRARHVRGARPDSGGPGDLPRPAASPDRGPRAAGGVHLVRAGVGRLAERAAADPQPRDGAWRVHVPAHPPPGARLPRRPGQLGAGPRADRRRLRRGAARRGRPGPVPGPLPRPGLPGELQRQRLPRPLPPIARPRRRDRRPLVRRGRRGRAHRHLRGAAGGGIAARPAQAPAGRRPRDHVRRCGGGAGGRAAEDHGRGPVQRCPVHDLRRRQRRDRLPGRWPHLGGCPRPGGAPRHRPDRGQPGRGACPGISPVRAGGGAARSRPPDRLLAPRRAAVRRCKRPRGARTRSQARGHGHAPDEERPHGRGHLPRRGRSRA